MEYSRLGSSSLEVSRIGFGCWAVGGHGWGSVDDRESIATIRRAVELGVTLFDTADVYGLGHSEKVLSEALGERRHDMIIATKFGVTVSPDGRVGRDCTAKHVVAALEGSLRRLRLDRIPLYQIHWPDPKTPILETLEALERCRREGKVELVGCSNFGWEQVQAMQRHCRIESLQMPYSLLARDVEGDILSGCRGDQVAFMAYDALAKGLLTGKFGPTSTFPEDHVRARDPNFKGERFRQNLEVVERLRGFGAPRGLSVARLAVRWVLDSPGVTSVLTGATKPQQMEENASACDFRLEPRERAFLCADE